MLDGRVSGSDGLQGCQADSSDAHQSLLALFWGMGVWIEPVESYTIENCELSAFGNRRLCEKNEKRPKGAVIASGRSSRRALSVRSALMASDVGAPAAAPEGSLDAASAPPLAEAPALAVAPAVAEAEAPETMGMRGYMWSGRDGNCVREGRKD